MTRLYDDPATFMEDMLAGFLDLYPNHVAAVPGGSHHSTGYRGDMVGVQVEETGQHVFHESGGVVIETGHQIPILPLLTSTSPKLRLDWSRSQRECETNMTDVRNTVKTVDMYHPRWLTPCS